MYCTFLPCIGEKNTKNVSYCFFKVICTHVSGWKFLQISLWTYTYVRVLHHDWKAGIEWKHQDRQPEHGFNMLKGYHKWRKFKFSPTQIDCTRSFHCAVQRSGTSMYVIVKTISEMSQLPRKHFRLLCVSSGSVNLELCLNIFLKIRLLRREYICSVRIVLH